MLTAAPEDGSSLSFLDQLRDSDADDLECVFFNDYYIPQFLLPIAAKQNFAEFASCNKIYTVPLYDLYCNWKINIS